MNKFIIRNNETTNHKFYLIDEEGNVIKTAQKEFTLVRFVKKNFPNSEVSIEYIDVPERYNGYRGLIHGDDPLPKEPVRKITNYESLFEE